MSDGSRPDPGHGAVDSPAGTDSPPAFELLRRAREGEREALNLFLERQLPPLKWWADRRLPIQARDTVDTENLVMESLLHTVRQEPEFRPKTDGALHTHLRNLVLDRIRDATPSTHPQSSEYRASAIETTIGFDGMEAYESALSQLDSSDGAAIVARVELRKDWRQVATALGAPSADEACSVTGIALERLAREMCDEQHTSERLTQLAVAVAGRVPVCWEDELRQIADSHERTVAEQLWAVDRIVQSHWSPRQPHERLGDFEILSEIGRGGMGVVYEARQLSLDRPVALKVLAEEMTASSHRLDRFEREAKALASLNHPNIVTIHSVEEIDTSTGSVHFITMELVDGNSLAELIPGGGLPMDRLLDLATPLADALSSAHDHGITHRDLKPSNVMVNQEGRVKILDFGLAKLREESSSVDVSQAPTANLNLTREGALVGTLPYMSPEQVQRQPLDHRSDLFSLGSVLFEMATGVRPFQGSTYASLIPAILQETPPPVTELNPDAHRELDRIVAHCMRKNPEDRYQTAKGLRNELEELRLSVRSADLPIRLRPSVDDDARPSFWSRARPYLVPAAVLAVVLIALLATPFIIKEIRRGAGSDAPTVENYLAVLPFTSLGDDEGQDALGAGLTEILTAKLTRLTGTHGLQVAPSHLTRGSPPSSVGEIGESLGVNLAVVGSLQRHDQDLRVTINLVDVRQGRQLGAEVITASIADPFGLQDRIVETAVRILELELEPGEAEDLLTHGTDVAEAQELYLQGRGYLRDYDDPDNVDRAIASFEQAIERDPDYAEAHAGLGSAYWKKYEHTQDPSWVDRSSNACTRSVELDQQQAGGHVCLGTVMDGTGRYPEATAEFAQAVTLDPTNDEAHRGLGFAYERLGQFDAAENTYREAVSLRPHYWATHNWLGTFYTFRGRFEEATVSFEKVVELVPNSYRGYQNLGAVHLLLGQFEQATPVLERSVSLRPTAHGYSNLATAYFGLRQFDEAVNYNQQAMELGPQDFQVWGNLGEAHYWASGQPEDYREAYITAIELADEQLQVNPEDASVMGEMAKYYAMLGDGVQAQAHLERALELGQPDADLQLNAAIVCAQLGQIDDALEWLEKSRAAGTTPGWIAANPVFDELGQMERFKELLR